MGIKIEAGRGNYTSFGGLALVEQIVSSSHLKRRLEQLLPISQRVNHSKSFDKFYGLLMGFVAGADCIEDMRTLSQDVGFSAVCKEKTFIPNSYGRYMDSFEPWQVRKINDTLRDFALHLRRKAFCDDPNLLIDIDTTVHQQYAKKMEGVGYNYNNVWGLTSLQAFDQYGFQYAMEVRKGGTYTSVGVASTIRNIFSHAPKTLRRILRADSGMCNIDVFNACEENRVSFVIAMRSNMFDSIHNKLGYWTWHKSEHKTRDGRECEVANAPYYPQGVSKGLRVVVLRALKEQPSMFEDKHDYFAFVTNIGENEMNAERILTFYQKRGNAENFIRELKNGFDIHHFPCRSLNSNNVYGLIAAFAYNCMRFLAVILNEKQMHFSKKIRFRMIYIGAQVVKKSRNWIIRMCNSRLKEVEHWLTKIKRRLVVSYMSG